MFSVLEEREDWLVVDKPPFLQVHPKGPGKPTLWDGLRHLLAYELANGGVISLINRLDRETSGIVLVAKTEEKARFFYKAMEARAFRKEYLAIVWGWPAEEAFEVNAPILRQGEKLPSAIYLKRTIHPEGAGALTRFQVEKRLSTATGERFAVIRAFPVTGRTHQIRLHLQYAGFPIVGDKIYGPDERCYLEFIDTGWTEALESRLLLNRHALHAARLSLEWREESYLWEAPFPSDLAGWMRARFGAESLEGLG